MEANCSRKRKRTDLPTTNKKFTMSMPIPQKSYNPIKFGALYGEAFRIFKENWTHVMLLGLEYAVFIDIISAFFEIRSTGWRWIWALIFVIFLNMPMIMSVFHSLSNLVLRGKNTHIWDSIGELGSQFLVLIVFGVILSVLMPWLLTVSILMLCCSILIHLERGEGFEESLKQGWRIGAAHSNWIQMLIHGIILGAVNVIVAIPAICLRYIPSAGAAGRVFYYILFLPLVFATTFPYTIIMIILMWRQADPDSNPQFQGQPAPIGGYEPQADAPGTVADEYNMGEELV
ncbi:hypothetical protein ADUPG1_012367 [Aduncisulcus paluster]|uniref:Transmembrane protein n=1 Tax=Aduncisulcus paluster TaxID=2918883 RepID=A0ABQ5K3F2_9EUKA|nr:hypothetical protein ADUPG1_012367 [Aduncisulcus paluster]